MNISRVASGQVLGIKTVHTRLPCSDPSVHRVDVLYFMLTIHPAIHYTFKDYAGIHTVYGDFNKAYYPQDLCSTWWRTNSI